MQILNPLIERRRQRTAVSGESWLDARLREGADTGDAQAGQQAAGEELAPVDAPCGELTARRLQKEVFLFIASLISNLPMVSVPAS